MGAHLITGYAGKEHITSANQGTFNAGTIGSGKYVLDTGTMFECEQVNGNLIKIHAGDLINQGRHITISANDYVECTIDNGLQGLKRNDLIAMRYTKNKDTGIENAEVVVLKGTSGETATDPDYLTGDILNGDMEDDFLLYRVKLEGIEVKSVESLFDVIPSASETQERLTEIRTTLENKQNTITGAATTVAANNLTASRALVSGSSGKIEASVITSTQLGYLSGVTSNIQPQIDGLTPFTPRVSNISMSLSSSSAISLLHSVVTTASGLCMGYIHLSFPSNATGFRTIEIRKNGAGIGSCMRVPAISGGATLLTLPYILYFASGDTLQVYASQTSGTTMTVTGYSTICALSTTVKS